jgi:metal-dependent amidase/aminoacylase/carboxypeptidase family protein
VRSFTDAAHERLIDEITLVCKGIAAAYGLEVDAVLDVQYPVTVNTAAEVDVAQASVADHHGADRWVSLPNPLSGSEDFSRVLAQVPGAMVFLGATLPDRDPDTAPFNHSPEAAFDESVMTDGVTLYADFALRALTAGS